MNKNLLQRDWLSLFSQDYILGTEDYLTYGAFKHKITGLLKIIGSKAVYAQRDLQLKEIVLPPIP